MSKPKFTAKLLYPRYWIYWLSMFLLLVLAQLPYRWQVFLGRKLGRLGMLFAKRRRTVAERNIAACFPDMSSADRQQLLKKNFELYGLGIFEIGMAYFTPRRRMQGLFEIKGQEHWDKLRGKGLMVIGMHFTSLEICNVGSCQNFDMNVLYEPHESPVYHYVQAHRRTRHNPNITIIESNNIRNVVRTLQSGKWLLYMPDFDYGLKSEFVPWFGIPAATVTATPRIAAISKVPVVGVSFRHKPDFSGYEIELHPVFDNFPSGDNHADLLRINQFIEECVRRHPEEYSWIHPRFKTRPPGEAPFY